ncbi:ubiquitin carboxyl-terminal hydrolase 38-like isoform X2 [Dreissena polymorpha]|nr:ubiquitin carboxyl-terminal hydrolase 38-like isoform X2 [Dreissena polymorpha]
MSWLRSKSYSLKASKVSSNIEEMDTILRGIVASDHPDSLKQDLLAKVAKQGSNQPSTIVHNVLDLTATWFLEGETSMHHKHGLNIYKSWAKCHMTILEEFFTKDYLLALLSKKYHSDETGRVFVLILHSMRILQSSAQSSELFRNHCTIIEAKATAYVREHPFVECLMHFSDFLLEFKECIPKGDITLQFCTHLVRSLSLCGPPDNQNEILSYVKNVNIVANLMSHIWDNTDSQNLLGSLQEIFKIISMPCDIEPSLCLGSLVPYIPTKVIPKVVQNVIMDSSIDNNSMVTALQRIIDWLLWPTTRFVDKWMIEFLQQLAAVQKYTILITVTENKVDQIFQKLQFVPVREPGLNIVSHMLLSFQHSPEPFHKILPMVPKIISVMQNDASDQSPPLLARLAELLHVLMYLHAGFPELYDPVYDVIKDFPKPSPDMIKFRLLESKWTAHRDGSSQAPRSYQPKAEMGKTGLFNLGNTCYMNSILQALYMCDSFREGVLQHIPTQEQGLIVKLQHVFAFLTLSQRPSYAPVNFLAASRPPWFMSGFQQDCSEFLKYLLDQLHEQETRHQKNTQNALDVQPNSSDSLQQNGGQDSTLIKDYFGGMMTSTIKCLNCGQESSKKEMFIDLPLAFPEYGSSVGQKSLIGGSSSKSKEQMQAPVSESSTTTDVEERNCLHLNDLLKHYLKPEKLTGDNKYHCENCGGLQEGERSLKIVETPEYLILTLLRFSYDTRLQSRSKVFREVKYPKTLLVPVSDHRSDTSEAKHDRSVSFGSEIASRLETCGVVTGLDNADVYSLCSVVIHSGTSSDCGHYYCYARHSEFSSTSLPEATGQTTNEDDIDFLDDKWYLFNDSRVSYASYSSFCNVSQRFTKDTAYVLMYRKVDGDKLKGSTTRHSDQSIRLSKTDTPLREDLRAAVVKDNKSYLQEQELNASKKVSRKRPNDFQWYNWKDDDDKGGQFGGGGNSFGDLDTSGSRFVF